MMGSGYELHLFAREDLHGVTYEPKSLMATDYDKNSHPASFRT
jgi:hypothetical protein